MVNAGCPILEMQSKKVSLEEIFLELTESEKKDKNSGGFSENDSEDGFGKSDAAQNNSVPDNGQYTSESGEEKGEE